MTEPNEREIETMARKATTKTADGGSKIIDGQAAFAAVVAAEPALQEVIAAVQPKKRPAAPKADKIAVDVKIGDLIRTLQTRVDLPAERPKQFAEAMKAGAQFPPIGVVRDEKTGDTWVWDGHTRVIAAEMLDQTHIRAMVTLGNYATAVEMAAGANHDQNAWPRSRADVRHAIDSLLKLDPTYSDSMIAKLVVCSPTTVGAARKELDSQKLPGTVQGVTTRKTASGKTVTVGKIGTTKSQTSKDKRKVDAHLKGAVDPDKARALAEKAAAAEGRDHVTPGLAEAATEVVNEAKATGRVTVKSGPTDFEQVPATESAEVAATLTAVGEYRGAHKNGGDFVPAGTGRGKLLASAQGKLLIEVDEKTEAKFAKLRSQAPNGVIAFQYWLNGEPEPVKPVTRPVKPTAKQPGEGMFANADGTPKSADPEYVPVNE